MATTAPRIATGRIPLDELCRLPTLYHFELSWNKDRVAFYWDKAGQVELYVMDLATRAIRQVSHGELPRALRSFFVWDRTDTYMVFAKDRDGDEMHDLYRIDVATGAVTQLSHDPKAEEHAAEFSPDNQWMTINTNRRHPDAPDRPGQMNLWKMRPDGSDYQPLTRYSFPAYGGHWSDDGRWLAFTTNEDATDLKNRDGYVVRPDGSGARKAFSVKPGSQDTFGGWHPDSRRIAVTSDASGVHQAGVLHLETGAVRWLSPADVEEYAVRFSPSGARLFCIRNSESRMQAVVYDTATGAGRVLALPSGIVSSGQFVDDDTVVLMFNTVRSRTTLARYDLRTDRWEALLDPEYGSIDPAAFVDAEHVWYPSTDGLRIPALLYVPHDIPPGERLPAVVYVHGGPTAQWTRGFDIFAQFLVDRGFVVLEPNIRGSTGYGVAFRDAALKDWGGKDLEDVAAGAAYLRTLPYVDPERLVVHGGSYGGFMTFIAATKKPDLWRAAIANVGISDLHRMWDEAKEHFRYFLREQMGDPVADRALWRDRSAIEFAHQLRAKFLMVHGINDPRCPVSQSRIFRDRLLELGKREGVDFDYVEWDDQGHGSVDIEAKVRRFRLLADWLERAVA